MPLSSIVTIVLRLFSFLWFVQSIGMFASVAARTAPYLSSHISYWNYVDPVLLLFAAIAVFLFSQPIARILTPPPNPELSLGGLSQYDLYCFAFTFLGLYFVLSSIGSTLNHLHYFILTSRTTQENDPERARNFYLFTQPLITLLVGGVSLGFASRCARKLTVIQRKHEAG